MLSLGLLTSLCGLIGEGKKKKLYMEKIKEEPGVWFVVDITTVRSRSINWGVLLNLELRVNQQKHFCLPSSCKNVVVCSSRRPP